MGIKEFTAKQDYYTVRGVRYPLECGRCKKRIRPGERYRKFVGRFGRIMIRCGGPDCYFRTSELSTGRVADVYAACEDVQEWEPKEVSKEALEELKQIVESSRDTIEMVKDEDEASAENIEEYFPSGNPTSEFLRERVDTLEDFIYGIEDAISRIDDALDEWDELEDKDDRKDLFDTVVDETKCIFEECPV